MATAAVGSRAAVRFARAAVVLLLTLTVAPVSAGAPLAAQGGDDPPTATLTSPAANAIVRLGQVVRAAVSDDNGVAQVEFGYCRGTACGWVDSTVFGHDSAGPPFEFAWNSQQPADGTYSLRARAKDSIGQYGISAPVRFFVDNDAEPPDTAPPTVTLTYPSDGSTINEEVELRAEAFDDRAVARVAFRYCVGSTCTWGAGTNIPPCASCAPYTTFWPDQPPNGSYTLLARAEDSAGNGAVSDPVSVTVFNRPSDTTPPTGPTLTLTEASANQHRRATTLFYRAVAGQSGSFTVRAATSDPESGIKDVEFPPVFGADAATIAPPNAFVRTYAWSVAAGASGPPGAGEKTVVATNRVGGTSQATFTVTPDAGKPTVAIAVPAANATIRNGALVRANASDGGSGVASVAFKACPGTRCGWTASNATPVGPVAGITAAPYRVVWNGQPPDGTYTIIARAVDRVGNATISAPVRVSIANGGATTFDGRFDLRPTAALGAGPVAIIADRNARSTRSVDVRRRSRYRPKKTFKTPSS